MSTAGSQAGRRVLVTGAQGLIGSWLTERLLRDGARVVVPDHEAAPTSRFQRERLADRCDVAELDLADVISIVRVLNELEIELVFHLAAQTIVAVAENDPLATFDVNVRGSYNLLEAARLLGDAAPHVVVASSYHAYGEQGPAPPAETAAMRPRHPYDVSKACADILARSYAATYGLAVASTRMANVYGGGDLNWSRIVPAAARALLSGKRPVIASDGTPERDYLYVEDAVAAYLAIARSLEDPAFRGRAWNVGAGRPVSVLALVRMLISIAGAEIEPEIRGRAVPNGAVDTRTLDSSAIRDQLGWAPATDLESGLRAAYAWYEANPIQ